MSFFLLPSFLLSSSERERRPNHLFILISTHPTTIKQKDRANQAITHSDDVLRAVKSLEPLGSGFSIITVGNKQYIRSVPKELNTDQATVLEAIQVLGYVSVSMLQLNLNWEKARAQTVIDDLLADGLVWLDAQAGENEYWSPQNLLGDMG